MLDSSNAAGQPQLPAGKHKGFSAIMRRMSVRMRRMFGGSAQENLAEAREAVAYFLNEMQSVAARTYPAWSNILNDGFSDCALGYDERRALFEIHPVEDYYFAAVVALEAVKIRTFYPPREADELLSEIGAQVDAKADRQDRIVSDLVFLMIGRIDFGAGLEKMKAPYDKVVKTILQKMGVGKIQATRPLLGDVAFRHLLGEPLALGIPQWWKAFQARFQIYWQEPDPVYLDDDYQPPTSIAPVVLRRRPRRRAAAF